MTHNKFDNEYYVMNVDGASNHPILAWGKTNNNAFLKPEPIEENTLELPLQIVFRQPYPKEYEMPDLLMLSGEFAASEKFRSLFEELKIYGIQFIPVAITTNKKKLIEGYYAIHLWNELAAIDKNNYEGSEPNRFANILTLRRFSLDEALMEEMPFEKRQFFLLSENSSMIIVHQSIVEAMQAAGLTGMRFWKVAEWDDNAMFR